ncbi:epoxide hydrolase family protein [Dactylosporangium sp. CA-139066]|uniref:epoxide hydrolase family protein n=1 Tax=Dactylosporangium sp. CA-139066 TaxID=3239930 RepID=UPI003D8E457E
MTFPLTPAPIRVDDDVLDDLHRRLELTRWPEGEGYDDPHYGVPRSVLRGLVDYWRDTFDWRAAERAINAYEHYTADVDGVPIHFMRRPGERAGATPLILSHGWPWTFWHWSRVVDDLARDFDVIVPSLPGFGFSGTRPGMNFSAIAELWHELMTGVLGFPRYAAAGCDVGALVTGQLGHKYAGELLGIHIGSGQKLTLFNGDRGWDLSGGQPIPAGLPPEVHRQLLAFEKRFAVHLAAHVLAPHTLAYGLTDSPAGMLAWILERWAAWSDSRGDIETVFTKDELLTHATIYWATGTIGTSMRTYANNNRYPWTPAHERTPPVEAPTGLTFVGYENPPGVSTDRRVEHFLGTDRAGWYNLVHLTAHDRGGHFIPWEAPGEWVEDLRRTFGVGEPPRPGR